MASDSNILIIGETSKGSLSAGTLEILGGGRRLADALDSTLALALLGPGLGAMAEEAVVRGADEVYVAEDPRLGDYQADVHLQILERTVAGLGPEILIMSQTSTGRDLAPRLACRLKTGLSMDCVELDIDPTTGLMRMTRPVYGCKALAATVCRTKPQMATVRAGAFRPGDPDTSRKGRIVPIAADIDQSLIGARLVERVEEKPEGVALEDARVVVSGGRGMGSAESFAILEDLAQLLGGAVGASRPPCDAGWMPSTRQVGLTGKIVRPDLYFAVALSGSSQHVAGCADAKTIVAVNRDPGANIFSAAHYGAVGDYREILPPFIERVREIRRREGERDAA
jgi:electron transfer flavoprotein alpha subunit